MAGGQRRTRRKKKEEDNAHTLLHCGRDCDCGYDRDRECGRGQRHCSVAWADSSCG